MNKLLKLTTATILSLSILISPISSVNSFADCQEGQEIKSNYSPLQLLEIEKSQHGIISFTLLDEQRNITIRIPYYDELSQIPEYVDSTFKYDYENDSLIINYENGINFTNFDIIIAECYKLDILAQKQLSIDNYNLFTNEIKHHVGQIELMKQYELKGIIFNNKDFQRLSWLSFHIADKYNIDLTDY